MDQELSALSHVGSKEFTPHDVLQPETLTDEHFSHYANNPQMWNIKDEFILLHMTPILNASANLQAFSDAAKECQNHTGSVMMPLEEAARRGKLARDARQRDDEASKASNCRDKQEFYKAVVEGFGMTWKKRGASGNLRRNGTCVSYEFFYAFCSRFPMFLRQKSTVKWGKLCDNSNRLLKNVEEWIEQLPELKLLYKGVPSEVSDASVERRAVSVRMQMNVLAQGWTVLQWENLPTNNGDPSEVRSDFRTQVEVSQLLESPNIPMPSPYCWVVESECLSRTRRCEEVVYQQCGEF
jgi:hypothetical protein